MIKIKSQLASLRKELKKHSNADRAVNEKRYLKSPYRFFGVSIPITEKSQKSFRNRTRISPAKMSLSLRKDSGTQNIMMKKVGDKDTPALS